MKRERGIREDFVSFQLAKLLYDVLYMAVRFCSSNSSSNSNSGGGSTSYKQEEQ